MHLKSHTLAGLALVVSSLAMVASPVRADHLPEALSQTETETEAVSADVEASVQKVRDVYSKICSKSTRAELPPRQPAVPQPVPVTPAPAVMPQMW